MLNAKSMVKAVILVFSLSLVGMGFAATNVSEVPSGPAIHKFWPSS